MSTPTGHHQDDPIDAPVRQLFWRLRARLVTPPNEQRTEADLDRLLRLAQVHAHVAPSVDAARRPAADAPTRRPDHPLVAVRVRDDLALAGDRTEDDDVVVPLRRGVVAIAQSVSRVAAVAVVALAVGVGVAGARDGSVSLDALLGRGSADDLALETPPVVEPVVPQVPDAATEDDAPADDAIAEEPTAEPTPPVVVDSADDDTPDAEESADDGPGEDASTQPPPGESSNDGGTSEPPQPVPSEDTVVAAPPAEEPAEEPAPAPDDLEGAGGPVPCDEDDLANCLPEPDPDETSDEPSDDGTGDEEPVDDGSTEPTEPVATDSDDLAARRFGGDR